MRSVMRTLLLARSAAALLRPRPASRFLTARAATTERVAVGEVVLAEPGVAVVRDTAAMGGADVVAGSRIELGNGRRGTVVLNRAPLCLVCLDDDGQDAGVDDATLALRRMALRSGERSGEADAFLVGEMEADINVEALAGRVVDVNGVALDGQGALATAQTRKIFQDGLETAQMAPIKEFVSTGVPAIDLMTPLGKGQSVLYVGPPEARGSLRRLARVAVAAQSKDTVTIYAGLDEAGNKRSQKKQFWRATGVIAPRARASAFASECEAVLVAHAAMAHGAEAMARGKDALVVLDGFEPLVDLWQRSTSILTERFGSANVGLGDDSECRAFFSAVLQRAGNLKGGGSLTVVALTSDEPVEELVKASETYTLDQFRAAGARKSIMDRLEALDSRGMAITDAILEKIGVAAPNTDRRPDAPGTKRRSEACEMLTSIGDAHVEVNRDSKGVCDIDASASLQRVGVGADVGTDTRPPALVTLGVGNRLRLELASATNVEDGPMAETVSDKQALVHAAAWRAALRVGVDDPPRSLNAVCSIAVAVQQGLFDGVADDAASLKVKALVAALPETAVDATEALSDADLGALKAAAVKAQQS